MKGSPGRVALSRWLRTGAIPDPTAEVLDAASEQGLCGVLASAVPPSWPAAARDRLQQWRRVALARGVMQLDAAARAMARLEASGIRTLPLKGAAVAETLYDSVGDRPMADVDLLVLDDFAGALRLLREEGFAEQGRADHAVGLRDPRSEVALELHRSVTSCPGLFPQDAEALWARHRPGRGQVRRLPSPEDLLVHLALHAAFQHALVLTLVQHLDLRRLLERTPPDPPALAAGADAARAAPALQAALASAEVTVGAPGGGTPPPAWLRARLADPGSLIGPGPLPLFATRWALVPGHRGELLARTVRGEPRREGEGWGARGARFVARAVAVARRAIS